MGCWHDPSHKHAKIALFSASKAFPGHFPCHQLSWTASGDLKSTDPSKTRFSEGNQPTDWLITDILDSSEFICNSEDNRRINMCRKIQLMVTLILHASQRGGYFSHHALRLFRGAPGV